MRVATRYQIATGFQSFQSNATRVGCNASSFAFPEFQFQSNATCVGCNSGWLPIIKSILFQSNATCVGCNSKLAQTKQQVVMHFVQCLSAFLTIRNSQTLSTIAISYPFYIILGAKRPVKPCSLIIRTCSKQKYRHLTTRWRYVDFKCLFAFISGML